MRLTGLPLFADYILLKTGNTGDNSAERDRVRDAVLSQASPPSGPALDPAPGMYTIMHRWRLPDSTDAILVRVEPKAVSGVSAGAIKSRLLLHADGFIRRYMKPLEGYELSIESADSAMLLRGYVDGITVVARRAQFGGFPFNPGRFPPENTPLSLSCLRLH